MTDELTPEEAERLTARFSEAQKHGRAEFLPLPPAAPASLAEALALLQTQLPDIPKASKAQYGMYADLADVSKKLLPKLGELGLSFSAKPTWVLREDGTREFVLLYKLRHVSGETDEGEYPLVSDGKAVNHQTLGGAITYGRRYSLCAITGAVADDDDDGQAAATAGPVTGRQPRAKPPQRAAAALPRNNEGHVARSQVTDEELDASGNMTSEQQKAHNKLERDVKGIDSKGRLTDGTQVERLPETPPDDPWLDQPAGQIRAPQAAGDPARVIAMHFQRLGIADRDVRLGLTSRLIGRPITSTKDLTAAEGVAVKRRLEKTRNEEAFNDLMEHESPLVELMDARNDT